ncbi:MAG: enolase C-terminal domain-like protein [Nanoarchaeota archaeon]
MLIKEVKSRAIKDSRGEKTIEVSVNGAEPASSPSGKSTGKYETKPYYKDLKFCVGFLNAWDEGVQVRKFDDLIFVEEIIKKKLKLKEARLFGGNALFSFESAILKTLAAEQKKELWEVLNSHVRRFPRPVGNVIGGGLHTKGKIKPVFQEFLLVPKEKTFSDNVKMMKKTYADIGKGLKTGKVNDEGAWSANLNDEEALKFLSEYSNIDIGVDIAASSFYEDELYDYRIIERTQPAHIEHVVKLVKDYGIFYVEDPLQEEDFEGFSEIKRLCREAMIVGDDLTATHIDRLQRAIENRSINAMIVKPNQNGSLLEVREIIELCKKHNIKTVMSHRSGETMDDALADYAFAFQCDFIKCGIATKWRECKLKRMEEIENSLK